ncbi:MAG TPA: TonB-dependent receptor [Thermoanaerobaculia bacterium]|nr:TonB-dependent receptor [Thermoanaerobaculia bacterium]
MIVLTIAPAAYAQVSETITVTATRTETRVAETPASVIVLSDETLNATAAPAIDDALRQVAGFTLFRRAGSRVANPTTQGVSLRGVGASGASRALVLDDGVPLNDPFGGWVYWGRVPRLALERVEVLRGGASDLYGSSAVGGVVQFIRRKSEGVSADVSAGSDATASATAFFGARHFTIAADFLSTGGFVLVRPDQRGVVDVRADSRHATLDLTARHERGFVRGSYYRESRNNGTPLQVNDTTIRHLSAGAGIGALTLRAYASDQDYFQTFSAIASDRNSERLTIEQRVPSRGYGGSAQWTRAVRDRHVVVAGAELRAVRGTSDELRFNANGTSFNVSAGGRQRTAAAYIEEIFAAASNLTITAGVRADRWSEETQLNPRVSVLWRNFSASAYTAFRAPTLNELHRGFRVGNVNTLPNADLRAENLKGFEIGARARRARLTLFWMEMEDTISNVTLGSGGGTITRQRRNLGETRSRGAELDAEWPLGRDWRASAGFLFVDATVLDGELRGRRLPQVPRQQATAQLSWRTVSAQLRWSAAQFDDDRNELPLGGYFVADVFASHPIGRGVDVTFALENVFDEAVEVSATPVITHGQPRAWRVGLRYAR